MPHSWGYGPENGPDQWHKDFPVAKEGVRQSPIDIQTDVADTDDGLKEAPLQWSYDPDRVLHIENTGHSWTVTVSGAGSSLTGGPLTDKYELLQFHAHWGSSDDHGSEHTVDGKSYPGELHLVHWNKKYNSAAEAITQPDGLAVLGVFIEVSEEANPEFEKLCKLLDKIKFKNQKASFTEPVDVEQFLPKEDDDKTFWTYEGSLTTPPLLESVTWIVFKRPIRVSEDQLNSMRSLMFCTLETHESDGGEKMVDNFRPPCPRGERKIRRC